MLQLLNPIWLFAITALSIPVIIHLWNIRPGKTLKVGSIAFIEAASRKSSRSFSLMDILLLILRCLLLLLLAILLAQPFWSQLTKSGKLKGWLLIPRQNIHQVYTQYKPRVDSLTKAGYELHYFNTGFAPIDTSLFKTLPDSVHNSSIKTWSLLKQLSQQIPANIPVYLFTPNMLNSIAGTKPELNLNLHVQTYTLTDSTSKWVQNAALISTGDAIKITEGNSKPSGTTYTNTLVQSTERSNSAYQINISNGQPSVSYKSDTINKAIAVDTATLRIAIYSDNSTDANYLIAALSSIKQFTQRKIEIAKYTDTTKIPHGLSWLFWLSDKLILASAETKTSKLFVYDYGKVQNVHSWIGGTNISLSKIVAARPAQIIWPDGFGNPVLSLDADGKTYHFSTHFDPTWNDLVWSNAFPQMMLNLLTEPEKDSLHDKRAIDNKQLSPRLSEDKTTATQSKLTHQTDLSKAFWLALVVIFLLERLLAHRTKSTENYD